MDTQNIALIVGGLLPPVVAFVQQPKWSGQTRAIVGALCALVVGVMVAWSQGQLNPQDIAASVAAVFTASAATYAALWKQIGVTERVELATTPRKGLSSPPDVMTCDALHGGPDA